MKKATRTTISSEVQVALNKDSLEAEPRTQYDRQLAGKDELVRQKDRELSDLKGTNQVYDDTRDQAFMDVFLDSKPSDRDPVSSKSPSPLILTP